MVLFSWLRLLDLILLGLLGEKGWARMELLRVETSFLLGLKEKAFSGSLRSRTVILRSLWIPLTVLETNLFLVRQEIVFTHKWMSGCFSTCPTCMCVTLLRTCRPISGAGPAPISGAGPAPPRLLTTTSVPHTPVGNLSTKKYKISHYDHTDCMLKW